MYLFSFYSKRSLLIILFYKNCNACNQLGTHHCIILYLVIFVRKHIFMRRKLSILFGLFFTIAAFSQQMENDAYNDPEGLMLDQFVILAKDTTMAAKDKASNEISRILSEFAKTPGSFDETFELKYLGKITSPDKRLNIYTWNYQRPDFSYKYGGVVQFRNNEGGDNYLVYELKHTLSQIPHDRTNQDAWYGCLYYKIIENHYKDAVTYTVFGWDGNNSVVARKIIDVITVNRNGAFFGKPIFYMEKGRMERMLFQYNARTVMMLDYEEKNERIIFDHLSPSDPKEKGNFVMYGPDSTYDTLEFKKGKWYLKKDVDLRLSKKQGRFKKPKKIKPMKAPKK